MRKLLTIVGLGMLLASLAGAALADDITVTALGTGSATGTVTAASPHATAVGKWIQVTGTKTDGTYVTFQLTGGATATVEIQASLDGTTTHQTHEFTASGEIFTVTAPGATVFRAVCTAFTSGSPVVLASASGRAQLVVQP